MFKRMNRREVLGLGVGGAAVMALGGLVPTNARASGRVLTINTLAAAAAVNVPLPAGLRATLPTLDGSAAPEIQPPAKITQIVQPVLAGPPGLGAGEGIGRGSGRGK